MHDTSDPAPIRDAVTSCPAASKVRERDVTRARASGRSQTYFVEAGLQGANLTFEASTYRDLAFQRALRLDKKHVQLMLTLFQGKACHHRFFEGAMIHHKLDSGGFQIERRHRRRITNETHSWFRICVLNVPAAGNLVRIEARLSLVKDFSLAVGLRSDGIVAQQESDGEHVPAVEACLVPARRHEIDRGPFLPATNLNAVPGGDQLGMTERRSQIVSGPIVVMGRPEVEDLEIYRVPAESIDERQGVCQTDGGPGGLSQLVGVMIDEPVGVDRACQLLLPSENPAQLEPRRLAFAVVGQPLDPDYAVPHQVFNRFNGAIRRSVVDDVDLDTLTDQVAGSLLEHVALVEHGDDGDDAESSKRQAGPSAVNQCGMIPRAV